MKLLSAIDENKDVVSKEWVEGKGYTTNTGTVTSVTLKATSPISIDSESAITGSGTRTLSHANSGVTAGTYRSVTVNATGHVTGGTNPTTLSGYGIIDAKINNGTITLGSNSITPLTSLVQADWNQTTTTADDYIKNKPTIPTVNNGTLTIQKNGTNVQTFSANQSGNATANITVPTILSGTTDPTSSQGSDGDIYIKIS